MRTLGRSAAALLIMVVAGCGTVTPDPGAPTTAVPATTPGPSSPSVSPPGAAQLTVVYRADGTTAQTWTLNCSPDGGTHPDPAAACAALAEAGTEPFAAVPRGQTCTQQYGGPQTATVTGTWRGAKLAGTFNRKNGCEIARWNQLQALLPSS